MSTFNYEWQVGDKASYLDKRGRQRKAMIVSKGPEGDCTYILKRINSKKWLKHPDRSLILFQESVKLQPRGKRTEVKYAEQYDKWKQDQDQNPEAGDYVVCETGIYRYVAQGGLYIVKELTPTLAKELDYFSIVGKDHPFYRWRHFRKATDEEIAEYKRANKTVWDLEEGELCFILYASGHIRGVYWANRTYHKQRNRGLIFLTKEAAEEADKKRVEENKQ